MLSHRMAKPGISREQYDLLLQGYREFPNNHSRASAKAKCDRKTAKRAYEHGWVKPVWAVAIKTVLEAEYNQIRAKLAQEEADRAQHAERLRREREAAELDLETYEIRELKRIRTGLTNAEQMGGVLAELVRALLPSVDAVIKELREGPIKDPERLVLILNSLSLAMKRVTEMFEAFQKMEQKRVGLPDQIVQVTHTPPMFSFSRSVELLGSEEAAKEALRNALDGTITRDVQKLLEACNPQGGS